jgi:hypothetical protein
MGDHTRDVVVNDLPEIVGIDKDSTFIIICFFDIPDLVVGCNINPLTGAFPSSRVSSTALKDLTLYGVHNNQITGTIPFFTCIHGS